jgi:hypothetical protein
VNHLTVRNLPPALAKALQREKRAGGVSLNQTVIRLLSRALGLDPEHKRSNGLRKLAGNWSQRDLEEFEAATAETRRIDPDVWR